MASYDQRNTINALLDPTSLVGIPCEVSVAWRNSKSKRVPHRREFAGFREAKCPRAGARRARPLEELSETLMARPPPRDGPVTSRDHFPVAVHRRD